MIYITEIDDYLEFLISEKLTQAQYLLLQCLYTESMDLLRKYFEQFSAPDNTIIGTYFMLDLVDKGFLIVNKADKAVTTLSDYHLTSKAIAIFKEQVPKSKVNLKLKYKWFEELREAYPAYLEIKGQKFHAVSGNEDKMAKDYYSFIKGDEREHDEVLRDILYGKTHDLLNAGLAKFIENKHWKTIRKEREAKPTIKSKVNNL